MGLDQPEFQQVCIHGRANKKTLVLYYGKSSLVKTGRIENYYGFEYGIDGNELYNTGINQAKNIGVDVVLKGFLLVEIAQEDYFKFLKQYMKVQKLVLVLLNI